jgi:hypothetical protein
MPHLVSVVLAPPPIAATHCDRCDAQARIIARLTVSTLLGEALSHWELCAPCVTELPQTAAVA